MLPLSPRYPRWSGYKYIKPKMVDVPVTLEAWLSDTSLFNNEPVNFFDIDFGGNEKANSKGDQTVLGLPDPGWFDENTDLSVLDNPNGLLDHRNETNLSMEDDSAFLLGLLSSSFDPSHLYTDILKNEEIDFSKEFDVQSLFTEPTSSEILDSHLASPQCSSLQVGSPEVFPIQSPSSPYSDISDAPEESSSYALQSPGSSYAASDFSSSSVDSPQVKVSVCDNVASPSSSEPPLSIEEVSLSVRKRKFVSNGESKPKIVKVVFPEDMPVTCIRKAKGSRERKKVQNKEAAARYRVKKRIEEKVLSDEVENLESKQKELQDKHDELQSEIKYLKSLMCEMLVKKGIMK